MSGGQTAQSIAFSIVSLDYPGRIHECFTAQDLRQLWIPDEPESAGMKPCSNADMSTRISYRGESCNRTIARLLCAWLAVALVWFSPPGFAQTSVEGQGNSEMVLHIGAVTIRNKEKTMQQWRPTVEFLNREIPEHRFELLSLNWTELHNGLVNGEVEFALTNPAMYVEFQVEHGIQPLATLFREYEGHDIKTFGSVVVRRADRTDILDFKNLRGKRFAAVNRTAWGGWYIAWNEFLDYGIEPQQDFSEILFTQSHDKVVYAVRDNLADAGTVRTGILEQMAEEGLIDLDEYTVMGAYQNEGFPYLVSSPLYPEWPFAVSSHVSELLKRKVLRALLRMFSDDKVVHAGRYSGWTVPENYQPVHTVLRRLKVAPYEHYGEITLMGVFQKYWKEISFLTVFFILLFYLVVHFRRLNRRLQVAEENLQSRNELLEETLSELKSTQNQVIAREKLASLGEITAGVAHEIKNPLNFIKNFSELTQDLCEELVEVLAPLKQEAVAAEAVGEMEEILGDLRANSSKIGEHSKRADSIVRNMLAHSRGEHHNFQESNLNEIVSESVNLSYHGMRSTDSSFNAKIETDFDESIGKLFLVPQDIGRVVLNLANNAFFEVHKKAQEGGDANYAPEFRVSTRALEQGAEIRVRDNGPGIPEENIERLFTPFFTTKDTGSGTGLGLSIVYDVIKKMHRGDIRVDTELGEYTEFTVFLPGDEETAKSRRREISADSESAD